MVAMPTYRKDFRDDINHFIQKVIRHQRLLITTNKSDLNQAKALRIIDSLRDHLESVNFTNEGMVTYFLDNQDDIKFLITSPEKQDRFNELLEKAQKFNVL